jgi:hypothetical protein
VPLVHKGIIMHISSALTLVRRAPAQSDTQGPARDNAGPTGGRMRKAVPGLILLTILALLGALFPMIF